MNKKIIVFLILLLPISTTCAAIQTVESVDAKSVIGYSSSSVVENGLRIKIGSYYDVRAFLEYDISGLVLEEGETVTLDIVNMSNGDGEGEIGVIDIYSYYGDGSVTVDDFDAGTYYKSFDALGVWTVTYGDGWTSSEYLVNESIDVTGIILDAIANGQSYIGFRLSTLTSDRYTLSYTPTLTIVPEPMTMLLLGLGGMMIRRKKQKLISNIE